MSDSIDRREADHQFKQDVQVKLSLLLTSHDQLRDQIKKLESATELQFTSLEERMDDLEEAVRGGIGSAGLDERMREVEKYNREHHIILLGTSGPLKSDGLLSRFEKLESGESRELEKRRQLFVLIGQIAVVFFTLLGPFLSYLKETMNPPVIEVHAKKPKTIKHSKPKPVESKEEDPPAYPLHNVEETVPNN